MTEIPIQDVKFEDFASLLSCVQDNPITPTMDNHERLLELAEQFLLPAAKRHLELYICSTEIPQIKKLILADKHNLDFLLKHAANLYTTRLEILNHPSLIRSFSDKTKARIFERFFCLPSSS